MMRERRRKTDWLVFLAIIGSFVSFAVGLKLNDNTREAGDRKIAAAAVERSAQLKVEAEHRAAEIEESRRDVLIRACREQNVRRARTIRELDRRLAALPPESRDRARESRDFTLALIEQLAPHRDCVKRADRLIR